VTERVCRRLLVVCVFVVCVFVGASAVTTAVAMAGSQTMLPEKVSRTPAQRKIDSQLLSEIYRRRGQAAGKHVPPGETGVKVDPRGRVRVDVRAEVTEALLKTVQRLGGTIQSTSVEHRSILAWVPLLKLEQLAGDPAVSSIQPAAEAITNGPPE
jgi:hypothetical protein